MNRFKVYLVSSILLFCIYLVLIAGLMAVLMVTLDLQLQGALIVTGIAATYEILTYFFAARKARKSRPDESGDAEPATMEAGIRPETFGQAVKYSIRRRVLLGLSSALAVSAVVLFILHFNPFGPIFWIAIIFFLISTHLGLLHLYFINRRVDIKKLRRIFLLNAFESVVFASLLFLFLTRTAAIVLSAIALLLALVNYAFYAREPEKDKPMFGGHDT